jgi:hypothetical protein
VPLFEQEFVPQIIPEDQPRLVHWTGNRVDAVEPKGKYLQMFVTSD